MNNPGRVLIIAGSDSGGGAGIQGDLKTVTCLGGYAATAITALTAQNTQGVFGIHEVPPAFIAQQIKLVLDDIGADAIKTGMLHSAEVIEAVADTLSSPRRGEAGRGASTLRRFPIPPALEFARALRKDMTGAEKFIWELLRGQQLDAKFRKQHPIGPYIADFACLNPKLIIELDGGQHGEEKNIEKDKVRAAFLEEQGFAVLRFWNNEVFENTKGVLETIYNALHSPHPNPPPAGEGIIPLVVDPVMVAKGGAALLQAQAIDALRTKLFPLAAMVTPNIPEAELLAEMPIRTEADMKTAATRIAESGAKAVLVKGGHLNANPIPNVLYTPGGYKVFTTPRLESRHTHGTGCTLASAIATGIAQGLPLEKSIERALDYVAKAIAAAPGLGHGHGPLKHNFMIS